MARSYLRLSEDEYWESTPRRISAMIREWRNIEIGRDRMRAYIANGGEVEMTPDSNASTDSAQEVDSRFL
jgi:hypothetical protein